MGTIWQTSTGGLYDCAWVPPNSGVVPSGLEENCVRLPSQIKVLRRVHWNEKAIFWPGLATHLQPLLLCSCCQYASIVMSVYGSSCTVYQRAQAGGAVMTTCRSVVS